MKQGQYSWNPFYTTAQKPNIPLQNSQKSRFARVHRTSEFSGPGVDVAERSEPTPVFRLRASRAVPLDVRLTFVFPVATWFPVVVSQYLNRRQLGAAPSQNRTCAVNASGSPPTPTACRNDCLANELPISITTGIVVTNWALFARISDARVTACWWCWSRCDARAMAKLVSRNNLSIRVVDRTVKILIYV